MGCNINSLGRWTGAITPVLGQQPQGTEIPCRVPRHQSPQRPISGAWVVSVPIWAFNFGISLPGFAISNFLLYDCIVPVMGYKSFHQKHRSQRFYRTFTENGVIQAFQVPRKSSLFRNQNNVPTVLTTVHRIRALRGTARSDFGTSAPPYAHGNGVLSPQSASRIARSGINVR